MLPILLIGIAAVTTALLGSSDNEKKKSANVTNNDDEYEREKRRQADQERKERVQKWNYLMEGYVTDFDLKNSLYVTKVSDIPKMTKEIENDSIVSKYMTYQLAKLQLQHAVNAIHQIDNLIQELS
jgi:hypothetical protein